MFVADGVTSADVDAEYVADSEADSDAVIVVENVGVGEADTPELCDGVLVSDFDAEYVAENVGVTDDESDAPTVRLQIHGLDAEHSSIESSELKYKSWPFKR